MNILITGSAGFVGRNLAENLKNIRDGKNRARPNLTIGEIYGYDMDSDESALEEYCQNCDFVFNLAGVNRPKDQSEFMAGNFGFAGRLLDSLKKSRNTCPVMLSSSIQASLTGRFAHSEYGRSKLEGERLFFDYAKETGARVLVYRFPNLFGKWCRPNYNSAVATFCHAVAHNEPYTVNDRDTELELLYIDDLVEELLDALEGKEHRCRCNGTGGINSTDGTDDTGGMNRTGSTNGADSMVPERTSESDFHGMYCYVPTTHRATLTHNIMNLSDTEDLVTVMWANEPFDPEHPDTFYEQVEQEKL